MKRWIFLFALASLLSGWGSAQELSQALRQELGSVVIEMWDGRIPPRILPGQRHPKDFEEAKQWFREACEQRLVAFILKRSLQKPRYVWAPFYRRSLFLAKGVYEKFGEFYYAWIAPDNAWGKYGDVFMPINEYFQEYQRWKENPDSLDPFSKRVDDFFFLARLMADAEGIIHKLPEPGVSGSTPLTLLAQAYYSLGEWKKAMETIEEMMKLHPDVGTTFFEWWLDSAAKVYQKGALPTEFLLVQNLKKYQTGLGAPALSKRGIPLLLRFRDGLNFISLWRIAWNLGWRVEQKGEQIFLKTQDQEVRLIVNRKTAFINGTKISLPAAVRKERNDLLVPLQFVASLARAKLRWKKGEGVVQMLLPERLF